MINTKIGNRSSFVLLSVVFFVFNQSLEARTFTSIDGRKIEAEIVKATETAVILKRKGIGNVTVPLDKLSKDDQRHIKSWAIEEAKNRIPRVEIVINTNKRDSRQDNAYEDREGSFQMEIAIENEELGFDIKNGSATLIVMGDYLSDKGVKVVMEKKVFKNINIADGATYKLAGDKVKYEYDKDGYKHGEKYWGYLFQFRNSTGKVIQTKAPVGSILKNAELILGFKANERFDGRTYRKAINRR